MPPCNIYWHSSCSLFDNVQSLEFKVTLQSLILKIDVAHKIECGDVALRCALKLHRFNAESQLITGAWDKGERRESSLAILQRPNVYRVEVVEIFVRTNYFIAASKELDCNLASVHYGAHLRDSPALVGFFIIDLLGVPSGDEKPPVVYFRPLHCLMCEVARCWKSCCVSNLLVIFGPVLMLNLDYVFTENFPDQRKILNNSVHSQHHQPRRFLST